MPAARFALSLDDTRKDRLRQYADANGVSAAAVIKAIIDRLPTPATEPPAGATEPGAVQVNVRLPGVALTNLDKHVESGGFLNRTTCARSLLLHALNDEPPLAEPEIQALRESRRELAAVGRNLNQIARALNTDNDAEGPSAELLQTTRDTINAHRQAVNVMIRKAEQRGA